MLTVPQAAARIGRDPETVRRWIRSGKLRARKIGTQHMIDEQDLAAIVNAPESLPLPDAWRATRTGERMPDWVRLIEGSRLGR